MSASVVRYNQLKAGADLLGLLFQWAFLGIISLQTHTYVSNVSGGTARKYTLAVYGIFLLELVQSISLAIYTIRFMIDLPVVDTFWFAIYIVTPITSAAVQAWYAKRIIELSRRHNWTWFIGTFCVLECIVGFIAGISLVLQQHGLQGLPFTLMVTIWFVLNLGANVLIVVSMSIMLTRGAWTCYGQATSVVTRLAAIIVETGSLMTTCYLSAFILQFVPNFPVVGFPLFLLSKLSTCTLLAALNNVSLNGEGSYHNVDLIVDDTTKIEMHSDVQRRAGYENADAGLGYVQYGP